MVDRWACEHNEVTNVPSIDDDYDNNNNNNNNNNIRSLLSNGSEIIGYKTADNL
jgi:hypothetical protein